MVLQLAGQFDSRVRGGFAAFQRRVDGFQQWFERRVLGLHLVDKRNVVGVGGGGLAQHRPQRLVLRGVVLAQQALEQVPAVAATRFAGVCVTLFFVSAPESVYAETSSGRIRYQVVGTGPPDVLATIPPSLPVDLMWDEPRFVRFLNGLSSFCRHIWFDSRGAGASDPIAPLEGRVIETVVDDMNAVLDELGCERVVVLGAASHPALQFATTHPERTNALALINPNARMRGADDYPEGIPVETAEAALAMVRDRWGTGEMLGLFAPSVAGDARFARWLARCERLSMPPQVASWVFRASFEVDVRHLLAAIRVPTLVVVNAGWFGHE
jgi:pimeloyl-ACP methyl ester carboxylesterase